MKNLLVLFIVLFFATNIFSQSEDEHLKITGKIDDFKTEKGLSGVTIKIYQDKLLMETIVTDTSGKYELKLLELNHTYHIHFIRKKYSYKFATVIAENPGGEKLDGTFPMEINTSLFKVGFFKQFRLSFMKKKATALAAYDSEEDLIIWDMEYIEAMSKKITASGGNK